MSFSIEDLSCFTFNSTNLPVQNRETKSSVLPSSAILHYNIIDYFTNCLSISLYNKIYLFTIYVYNITTNQFHKIQPIHYLNIISDFLYYIFIYKYNHILPSDIQQITLTLLINPPPLYPSSMTLQQLYVCSWSLMCLVF